MLSKSISEQGAGAWESLQIGAYNLDEHRRDPLIWDAETDVVAGYEYLVGDSRIDSERIAIVAASYSGEESAEAGRLRGYAAAYVLLSPGSLSAESIDALDASVVPWLIVAAREDSFLTDIMAGLGQRSERATTLMLDGRGHATDLLETRQNLPSRLVDWLLDHLR